MILENDLHPRTISSASAVIVLETVKGLISQMATGRVKIWVKIEVEGGKPRRTTGVHVENNADVDDLVAAALEKEKVNIARDLVTVEFEGLKIRKARLVTEFDTSVENPLLLKCHHDCQVTKRRKVINLSVPALPEPLCNKALLQSRVQSIQTSEYSKHIVHGVKGCGKTTTLAYIFHHFETEPCVYVDLATDVDFCDQLLDFDHNDWCNKVFLIDNVQVLLQRKSAAVQLGINWAKICVGAVSSQTGSLKQIEKLFTDHQHSLIEITPLPSDSALQFLREMGCTGVSDDTLEQVVEVTGGNPLLMKNYLRRCDRNLQRLEFEVTSFYTSELREIQSIYSKSEIYDAIVNIATGRDMFYWATLGGLCYVGIGATPKPAHRVLFQLAYSKLEDAVAGPLLGLTGYMKYEVTVCLLFHRVPVSIECGEEVCDLPKASVIESLSKGTLPPIPPQRTIYHLWENHPVINLLYYTEHCLYFIQVSKSRYSKHESKREDLWNEYIELGNKCVLDYYNQLLPVSEKWKYVYATFDVTSTTFKDVYILDLMNYPSLC